MGSSKDDEDFWYSSEKLSFCFENNEVDQVFGVPKNTTNKLWAGIADASTSDGLLRSSDDVQPLKPMLSVISEKTLACILDADKPPDLNPESAIVQPDITLRKILLGQPYTLEQYKSLSSKTALLDAAIISGDGNAILIIVLFLTKTLKRSIVQRLLSERPEAVDVYISYLSIRLQIHEVTDILTMLGQVTDAAMKTLNIIIKNTRDPERLLQKIQNCYKTQFLTLNDCPETSFVQCYIKLLEWQIAVKKIEGNEALEFNSSVCEWLRYTCRNYWDSPEGSLMSPTTLAQQHDLSQSQYQKVVLQVRAESGAWEDIDRLFLTKGWLGNKKLQTSLPVDDILKIMHRSNAPPEILEKYLKFLDNVDRRLELAKDMRCHRVAVDIFVQQGDRSALFDYKSKLQPESEEYLYAESSLRLPSVKWRN